MVFRMILSPNKNADTNKSIYTILHDFLGNLINLR